MRRWANKLAQDEVVEFDKCGLHRPEHFLDDEEIKARVQTWMVKTARIQCPDIINVQLIARRTLRRTHR